MVLSTTKTIQYRVEFSMLNKVRFRKTG